MALDQNESWVNLNEGAEKSIGPNDYGRTPEHERSADEPIVIKQSGPDLSVDVDSMPGFWERCE